MFKVRRGFIQNLALNYILVLEIKFVSFYGVLSLRFNKCQCYKRDFMCFLKLELYLEFYFIFLVENYNRKLEGKCKVI